MENMLPLFYKEIIQHLKNWVKPAPKILQKNIEEDSLEIADPEQRTYRAGSTEGHGGFPTS
jgi:hypothetical protein